VTARTLAKDERGGRRRFGGTAARSATIATAAVAADEWAAAATSWQPGATLAAAPADAAVKGYGGVSRTCEPLATLKPKL